MYQKKKKNNSTPIFEPLGATKCSNSTKDNLLFQKNGLDVRFEPLHFIEFEPLPLQEWEFLKVDWEFLKVDW
jgi:hypothetical protein